jgi:hypothetical protein
MALMIRLLTSGLAFWVAASATHAALQTKAAPNPSLTARDSGVDDARAERNLDIADLDVIVEIVGNVARTTVAAHFTNPGGEDLEATFSLQLPDGAVVTSYALDVEGKMIDGVLAPPIRARRAYEEKVRAGIDPGVAEVSRGNVFSTRVYPVLRESGRTIRLTFAAPVHAARGFTLPLASAKKAGRVALIVRAREGAAPNVTWPAAVKSEWHQEGAGGLVNDVVLRNQAFAGELHVDAAKNDGRVFVTRHPGGKRFVDLRDVVAGELADSAIPRTVRVYWDRSLSRRDDRIAAELGLLEKYLATGSARIEIVPFNSSGAMPRKMPDAASALRGLRAVIYRGATSFAVLAHPPAGQADVCLLFSDGAANLDARPELDLKCPLFVITSAPDADRGYLELLARRNGGAVLRLDVESVDACLSRLRSPAPRVIDVRAEDGAPLRFAPLAAPVRGWALLAEAPAVGGLVVRISNGAGVVERRYSVVNDGARFSATAALWAGDRVSQLAGDGTREQELRDLSQRYSIASPAMSFVVLESPADYLQAKIAPPRGYPREMLQQYLEAKRERDQEAATQRKEWLNELVEAWEDQKEWWQQEFAADAHARKQTEKKLAPPIATASAPARAASGVVDSITAEDIGRFPDARRAEAMQRVESIDEVMVTGFRASGGPEIAVELEPWNPARPYLAALDAAAAAHFERVLAGQEQKFGAIPVFYFDVAEWLYRKGRAVEAAEMLASALELPARDTETIALVADRLLRYGHLDRAIWLYEEVRRLDPDRPQPARTLALALARRALTPQARQPRADLERALALLGELVMTPPADEYEGIELVTLMDANAIIPRLRALGSVQIPLDPRLVALLDLDLRVIIEWNTGATDMDLWVDQPDGERSIYSNPRTDIGGRLSNDMTAGYGPEEYLLKAAIPGEYGIRVNVYASDALNPNGATMVTAHLTRNYGRANQSSETMELELKPDESGEKLVGRFKVGARSSEETGISGSLSE